MSTVIQYVLYLAVLVALAIPLGRFMAHVMDGERTFLTPVLAPVERGLFRLLHIDATEQMGWKRYLVCVLAFSGIGLVVLIALQLLQGVLPPNPEGLGGVSWDLSFNTAVSFVTNTNWQAYSGETTLSYLTQLAGLTVQNFVSAATGISVMFALIRGFRQVKREGLGSFWVDLSRVVIYVLLPLNLVLAIALAAGGVVSNFQPAQTAELMEPVAVEAGRRRDLAGDRGGRNRRRHRDGRRRGRRGRARGDRAVPAAGPGCQSGCHQAVRYQRRRLLRGELRAPV